MKTILSSAVLALATVSLLPIEASALTLEATSASGIYQGSNGGEGGWTTTLYAMGDAGGSNAGHAGVGYVYFDLSGLASQGITSSADITSVTLKLYSKAQSVAGFMQSFTGSVSNSTFYVADADSLFNSSDTGDIWGNRPTAGGNFLTSETFIFEKPGATYVERWYSIDVTELVKFWYDNPSSNFGFYLYGPDAPSYGASAFVSSGANGPVLEVIPEPSSYVLFGAGAALFAFLRRRSTKKAALSV